MTDEEKAFSLYEIVQDEDPRHFNQKDWCNPERDEHMRRAAIEFENFKKTANG